MGHQWKDGRKPITVNKKLSRELLRIRESFLKTSNRCKIKHIAMVVLKIQNFI